MIFIRYVIKIMRFIIECISLSMRSQVVNVEKGP